MIEDELRSVMTAHDEDAPNADGFDPLVRRDLRRPSIVAAVVVIALLVTGLAWLRSSAPAHQSSADGRPPAFGGDLGAGQHVSCPKVDGGGSGYWVPDTSHAPRDALVPRATPDSATVCAYQGETGSGTLTGHTVLGGNLSSITAALRSVKPHRYGDYLCTLDSVPTDIDSYLVVLTYGRSAVWVAAPGNGCLATSNGRFTGATNLRAAAAQAYRHGVWDTDPSLQKLCEVAPNVHASRTLSLDPTGLTLCVIGNATTVYRFNKAQLDQANLGIAGKYNGYLARAPHDAVCGTFDTARQRIVARLTYRDQHEAVLVGTPSCIAADGGVAVTGKFAARVFSLLYFAPSYLR